MSKTKKLLPIGISDFKKVIDGGYVYVDKSLIIKEIMEKGGEVSLIPRMRRFGKTLNLSMLRYFFEQTEQDTSYLFKLLNIWQDEKCRALQGKFPVIFLTLKDAKQTSWKSMFEFLSRVIAEEFERHRYLFESDLLSREEKEIYHAILTIKGSETLFERSLKYLTEWLHRFHKKRVILLIDEYDAPAHAAYIGEYYEQLITFLRTWLSGGLKDNISLEKGVLTRILRIAKESIFSGLNNVEIFTVFNRGFQDKFGLTEEEVKALLTEYGLLEQLDDIRKWYNGYRIGAYEGIYNPWSVLHCIKNEGRLAPYWVNTSENSLMRELVTQGSEELKADLEELIRGGTVKKTIEDGLVFPELKDNPDAVWSLFLYSGYLSLAEPYEPETPYELRIPNHEVKGLYNSIILRWFKQTIEEEKYNLLLKSLTSGDVDTFSQIFEKFLLSAFSYFDIGEDESEKIYHSFVLGVLIGLKETYDVKSNRESGLGRYDVMLIPKNRDDLGIVFEFKKARPSETLDLAAASPLKQIEERKYDLELKAQGVCRIMHLGMAFKGKGIAIRSAFLH
jgi:predicted AAA-ATPase/PD-(D/E)XK nuclease superfamily protein